MRRAFPISELERIPIKQAIEYVAGFHYIDDLRYAVDYITYHENSRSRRRIEQDLQGKGISSATIEEAWQNWRENGGEQDETERSIEDVFRKVTHHMSRGFVGLELKGDYFVFGVEGEFGAQVMSLGLKVGANF